MATRTLVAYVAATVLAASCGTVDPSTGEGTTPATIVRSAPLLPTTTDGLPLMDPASYATLLRQLEGTPVVVNFWASWCPPCIQEASMLRAAAEEHADRIQFLGVNILDARTDAESFIREQGLPYPNVFDPEGVVRNSVGSIGQPVTVFYRADGEVVVKIDGPLSDEALADALAEIVR